MTQRNRRYTTGLFAGVLIASGCVGIGASYPDEWVELYRGDDIEDRIVGFYSCQGEIRSEAAGTYGPRGLGHFLQAAGCAYLRIEQPRPDHFRLYFHYGPGRPIPKVVDLERGPDYDLHGPWIVLESDTEFQADAVVSGWIREKPALTLTRNGDLVARLSTKTLALVWIVPLGESARDWGVFPRIPEPEMSAEDREAFDRWLEMDED